MDSVRRNVTAPLNQLDWWRQPAAVPADPPIWRDLPRICFLLAALGYILGSLLPWVVGLHPTGERESFRATQGTGEGVVLIAGGLLLLFLARTRVMWETTTRSLQLLPLAVALISGAMWLGAEHYAAIEVIQWLRAGLTIEYTTSRLLVAGAIGLTIAGFAWLELRRPASVRARTNPLLVEWGVTRWAAGSLGAAIAFGLVGGVIGLAIGLFLVGVELILLAVILAIFGMFIGIGLGLGLVRWLAARLRQPEE